MTNHDAKRIKFPVSVHMAIAILAGSAVGTIAAVAYFIRSCGGAR